MISRRWTKTRRSPSTPSTSPAVRRRRRRRTRGVPAQPPRRRSRSSCFAAAATVSKTRNISTPRLSSRNCSRSTCAWTRARDRVWRSASRFSSPRSPRRRRIEEDSWRTPRFRVSARSPSRRASRASARTSRTYWTFAPSRRRAQSVVQPRATTFPSRARTLWGARSFFALCAKRRWRWFPKRSTRTLRLRKRRSPRRTSRR
mmetsp:Transcript_10727/g.45667  ORF Transcript_10727/g.45667 Transcript_10727/m.45667 type:complete len:202 (-) Transcript_10727:312-917(-)